eukprot:6161144-Amphidinium_carterae.1
MMRMLWLQHFCLRSMSRSRPAIAKFAARDFETTHLLQSRAGNFDSPVSVLSPPLAKDDDDDVILIADLQAYPPPTRSAVAPRSVRAPAEVSVSLALGSSVSLVACPKTIPGWRHRVGEDRVQALPEFDNF